MTPERNSEARVDDDLDVLAALVPIAGREIVELGCGAAALARALLARHPDSRVTGLEVDERQHAKNLASPQPGLQFVASGAQSIPAADASFDVALMLKSLHHVPMPLLAQALTEVARVLRPRGTLYVSEPVFGGPLNDDTASSTTRVWSGLQRRLPSMQRWLPVSGNRWPSGASKCRRASRTSPTSSSA